MATYSHHEHKQPDYVESAELIGRSPLQQGSSCGPEAQEGGTIAGTPLPGFLMAGRLKKHPLVNNPRQPRIKQQFQARDGPMLCTPAIPQQQRCRISPAANNQHRNKGIGLPGIRRHRGDDHDPAQAKQEELHNLEEKMFWVSHVVYNLTFPSKNGCTPPSWLTS